MRPKHILTVSVIAVVLSAVPVAVHSWVRQNRQHQLVHAAGAGDLATVQRCVDAGADLETGIRQRDGDYGLPPLTLAAYAGHTSVVRYLLDHGANPDLPGMSNPLIVACWRGHYEVAKLLIERGADVNARGEGTPLYAAEGTNQPELVALLRAHGAKQ